MNTLPPRERMKIRRQPMPEQAPHARRANFAEVNLGFAPQHAGVEAQRCLQCNDPGCVKACPVGVKVKDFVDLVLAGDYLAAAAKVREDNVLPAVTGRVCPQEEQCEGACVIGRKSGSLAIGNLERFVADWERRHGKLGLPRNAPPTGRKVAIIGSGPAGLSAAGDLVQRGHEVVVFEALHELGGVLVYGIPEFRLPKQIVRQEVENLAHMGVQFETNVVVGRTVTIDSLMNDEGFDAVFIATGAGLPQFLEIPGEHLNCVYSANEYLTRVNLLKAYDAGSDQPVYDCRGRDIAVIGGGNVAMDAVRTAVRLGAANAFLLYRRTEAEMPARKEEVKHAKEEGVQILSLTAPVEFLAAERGWLGAVRCQRMELGDPDAGGRRRPVPIPGDFLDIPVTMAIIAVGTTANPLVQATTPDLQTRKGGYIAVRDDQTLRTSKRGVFAGGDIVTGVATVILAMGAGRKAAASIHAYLTTDQW
jgi:glutamate synthase (NADPH/NADH) small chain